MDEGSTVIAQFQSEEGEKTGQPISIPANITAEQLHLLINDILDNDEPLPYNFFVNDNEVKATSSLDKLLDEHSISTEEVVSIVYQPQAVFRVRSITRCSGSLAGHTEAVLSVQFSPDGTKLASGSGDTTVRLWDVETATAKKQLRGHTDWVLCVAWSPDGKKLATGSNDNTIRIWDAETGKSIKLLKGHKKWITSLSWEPCHLNPQCVRLASSSRDGQVKIWNVTTSRCLLSLTGHTACVSCVKWGGEGLLFSASRDRTIKVWTDDGKLVRTLDGHAHWVNSLALNTDYVLRTGQYDHTLTPPTSLEDAKAKALKRYEEARGGKPERLVSCSDDNTMFLWHPAEAKKPILRMHGHARPVNLVSFSPDGRLVASASWDNSLKLWDGITGKFISTCKGHVNAVYQVCWSSDSRMVVSGSKDSTVKVWSLKDYKILYDLPGHADEVYAVDWSPDGQRVVSGSKDRLLKIWRH
eukprot:TRINITY_DN3455_c0_g1_i1.p1 TRINITY_DN3455_c0_g1~~TRINITY_DN3455_c0_g1_i1.p1  ORF type:complete len:489 (+),score=18.48 TRINITY_DN3455_c0_g1_i1:60-1469(+)